MSEEKKIIIDDDWKSQVAAEKEALKKEAADKEAGAQPEASDSPGTMPPASLELLITTLATEAMVAMGQIPNPATGESSSTPEHARYAIDMLEVLQEKTKGNLTPGEENMLEGILHQLRMAFVSLSGGQ